MSPVKQRFNKSFLTPTPNLQSREIQENIRLFPLIFSKNDHMENEEKKVRVSNLIHECSNMIQRKEIQTVVKEHEKNILAENYAFEQLMITQSLLKEIDYVHDADGIKPLYNYKLASIQEAR